MKESAKTRRLQVRLEPWLYDLLSEWAAGSGETVSACARTLLFAELSKRQQASHEIAKQVKELMDTTQVML